VPAATGSGRLVPKVGRSSRTRSDAHHSDSVPHTQVDCLGTWQSQSSGGSAHSGGAAINELPIDSPAYSSGRDDLSRCWFCVRTARCLFTPL